MDENILIILLGFIMIILFPIAWGSLYKDFLKMQGYVFYKPSFEEAPITYVIKILSRIITIAIAIYFIFFWGK